MKNSFENKADLKRRDFLKWSGSAAFLLGFPQWSAAMPDHANDLVTCPIQSPVPVVDARFPSRIADGIWLITDKRIPLIPNIGIVEGDDAVLVIDCGINPACGKNVLDAAKQIAGKRKLILTITHAHPEHTFGSQAFEGEAKIYYNQLQHDYLLRNGQKLLQGFRKILPPQNIALLDNINITLADETYADNTATLDLGNRKVIFKTWGIAHSPGDQVISIPDQKILFAGDLIEERKFPIVPFYPPMIERADINLKSWEIALQDIKQEQPRIIIPGHCNIGGVELADAVLDYFTNIQKMAAQHKAKKITGSNLIKQLEPAVLKLYPTWEQSEFILPALQYLA